MLHRRSFLKAGAATLPLASFANLTTHAEVISSTLSGELESSALFAADATKPGQQKVRRVGQPAADKKATRVELLRSAHDVPFHTTGRYIEFAIPT